MNPDEFYKEFITTDFDEILHSSNNAIVNSSEHYLIFKNKYMNESYKNFNSFKDIFDEKNQLQSSEMHSISSTKTIYKYIDHEKLKDLEQQIGCIIKCQRHLKDNFLHYVHTLNNWQLTTTPQAKSKKTGKNGLFSRKKY